MWSGDTLAFLAAWAALYAWGMHCRRRKQAAQRRVRQRGAVRVERGV